MSAHFQLPSETATDHKSAALDYAGHGWPVFPVRPDKRPLTEHGRSDATTDNPTIMAWWSRWPSALVGVATGTLSGLVVIDIDVDKATGLNGWDSLAVLGVDTCPITPCDVTPRGGSHLLFRHPGGFVKTIAGKLGPGLDVRGDGGCCIFPPGPGRCWDAHLNLGTMPPAAFPAWARIGDQPELPPGAARPSGKALSRYGEAALDRAVAAIIAAPMGQQRDTLNRAAFGIGRIVGGDGIPLDMALAALKLAAGRMPSFDARRPWRRAECDRIVRDAVLDGIAIPRPAAR